jgi:hypothetical protein
MTGQSRCSVSSQAIGLVIIATGPQLVVYLSQPATDLRGTNGPLGPAYGIRQREEGWGESTIGGILEKGGTGQAERQRGMVGGARKWGKRGTDIILSGFS